MLFSKKTISLSETGIFSDLILDFVKKNESIRPLVDFFPDIKSVKKKIKQLKVSSRIQLVNTLKVQYEKTNFFDVCLDKVNYNIDLISHSNVYTITTGHQLNIFSSPLFLIYKIISIINYSKYLNKNIKNCQFVPLFWMATDDHDFKEIQSFNLFNSKYEWDFVTKDVVGNLSTDGIHHLLNAIEGILKTTSHGEDLYSIYKYVYTKNSNYADANRSLLTSLFGEYGLVILDPNDKSLKKIFIDEFKSEIDHQNVFKNVSFSNNIISKNYKPEINPLINNIFYLSKNIRAKIEFDQKKRDFFSKDHKKRWSKEELFKELDLHPSRFSPNVFLRTLYQQKITPSIIYIGGPSEISYWLQLKLLFDKRNIDFPLLELRSFFLILSSEVSNFYKYYSLSDSDLFQSHDRKIKKIIKNLMNLKFDTLQKDILKLLNKIESNLNSVDGFSMASFYVFKKKVDKEYGRLESKIIKSQKNKYNDIFNKLNMIDANVLFNNLTQERIQSFIPFYMKYGKSFFSFLINESSTFDNKYIILTEKD